MLKLSMELKLKPQTSKGNQEDRKWTLVNALHGCVAYDERPYSLG